MPTPFLHGVETVDVTRGPAVVRVVKYGVIFLAGTAPMGPVNALTWVRSEKDAAQFGRQTPGFTIPQALRAILKKGTANILVVNVADSTLTAHKTTITAEARTFANNVIRTTKYPIVSGLAVKNTGGTTTYVLNTDYTVDMQTGIITRKPGGAITATQAMTVDYTYLDSTKVVAADVIGTANVSSGLRSGLQLALDAKSTFGFKPKLLIAPGFSTASTVAAEMLVKAAALRAYPGIDAPAATTVPNAIAGRGPTGTIGFNIADKRAVLLYPLVKALNVDEGTVNLEPLSQHWAGLTAAVHGNEGPHVSPSNHVMADILGVERPISWDLSDATCDANALNEVGITTVVTGFGTGIRLWGNRTAAWPTDTSPDNFFPIRMVRDIIAETIEEAMLPYLDRPINRGLIDTVTETINRFFRVLVGRGWLLPGSKCIFDPAKNDPTQIAGGQLVWSYTIMPPPPFERGTFEQAIDIEILRKALA